jgi:1,4-alpha-glucan branching enzyme
MNNLSKGYIALILHAHLPYVRHMEHEDCLEERWFYEAMTETYLPLLHVLEKLSDESVPYRLTISFSPTLLAMFTDGLLQKRYQKHLEKLLVLAKRELQRTANEPVFNNLARMYEELLERNFYTYVTRFNRNIITGFKKLQDTGFLEIITTMATHCFAPLYSHQVEVLKAQIKVAIQEYLKHFGKKPEGMWLPECGYFPGLDELLKQEDIKYFFVESHGLLYASPRPKYGIYTPIRCPSGVAAFARDVESTVQVWSAELGYPGDFMYREFYRDIGYDLPEEYIKEFLPGGIRSDTGFKYYKITGKGEWKEPYIPEEARSKAELHAWDFVNNRSKQIDFLASHMETEPIIVSPYDAELFGHWWFEGPHWLEHVLRNAAARPDLKTVTPGDYLNRYTKLQTAIPCASSWGNKGYNDVWLNGTNDWIYRHLHQAGDRMIHLANTHLHPDPLTERALNQAARELLYAQSSDWAFIMKTGTMVEYAKKRTIQHLSRFNKLYEAITKAKVEPGWLIRLERKDNLFPDLSYKVFC